MSSDVARCPLREPLEKKKKLWDGNGSESYLHLCYFYLLTLIIFQKDLIVFNRAVILGKLFYFCEPWFSPLQNGNHDKTCLVGLLRRFIEQSMQCAWISAVILKMSVAPKRLTVRLS